MWRTPTGTQKKPSDAHAEDIARNPDDYRVLEKVPLRYDDVPIRFAEPHDDDTTVVIVDFETTGLSHDADKVIEIGMVRCRYDSEGRLAGVDEALDMFEDPGEPIADNITELTGITDDMVRGKRIDADKVRDMIRGDPVMAAHNAKFDRPFFDRIVPNDHRWKCTMEEIPWWDLGHGTRGLGELLMREGWFFDHHRAYADCLATAWLLSVVPGSLSLMLEPSVRVVAHGNSFDVKDELKGRGYKWNQTERYWWTSTKDGASEELEYLRGLYPDGYKAKATEIDPRTAYKLPSG